ncbi:MAG TPA: sulfite exporter TauE/SafE family protein [Anaerolineales bacterium]|nr:sulfite exporter TauE/SafE family protein [Anaerolineales bacterium]
MKKLRHLIVVLLTLFMSFIFVPAAFAHPLGNFTINQYVGLNLRRETVIVDYVLDMAEIPAFQEIAVFDADGNGQPDAAEAAGYHAAKCASLRPSLNLSLNNRRVDLTLVSSSVEFPAGVGGLPTMRLSCEFRAALDLGAGKPAISFTNNAFPDRLGWKEIVVTAEGVSLQGDFATASLSQRLTNYPQDLLTSPLDQRQVRLNIAPVPLPEQNGSTSPAAGSRSAPSDRNDAFTRLILLEEITIPALLLALAISFIWGGMHAMTPGHGKTIVGAYLVGSRGTVKHAVYLGLTTTITHTLGVFALGLITLFAAQFIVPEKLYPWMSLLSGLFVVGIGLNLFVERFRSSGLKSWMIARQAGSSRSRGLAPGNSAILSAMLLTGPGHPRRYVLHPSHGHFHSHDGEPVHAHSHQEHQHHHGHEHGHTDHSHLPPGADGSPVTWRSLLALGISGGLLPCPSALVVLLGAIALNRIGLGLVLVLAFSLGLAGALTAIGIMFIYAGRLFERFPARGKILQALPVLSALLVAMIGVGIMFKALAEIGVI